jgi:tetratricopeptide (TPR) repeat protein
MKASQKHIDFFISAALVIATLVAYEPVRRNGFVSCDDYTYVRDNPKVNQGITGDSVIWAFTKSYTSNWHPLTWLSHMLDCEIYGLNPLGHHITSVLIHAINSVLLFWVLWKMTGTTWPSAFSAAVFALHPVHVESVAWVAERKDVLSGLFWMLTMLAYVHYAKQPSIRRYVLILLAFLMGLMAKPMLVTLPFVLLLLDWWPMGRLAWLCDDISTKTKERQITSIGYPKTSFRHLAVEKVPLIMLTVISSVVTLIVQRSGGSVIALRKIPLDRRIDNTFISYISYIGKTLWPSRLVAYYPLPLRSHSETKVVVCILLLFLITVISIFIGRRRKYAAVGWLWYIGTLVPVIGLVQVGSQSMADRYMYIPMVGLLLIIAWSVKDLVTYWPRLKIVAATLTFAILLSLLILTRMQVRYWQNSLTLFERILRFTENNNFAEGGLALALADEGRFSEAEFHLREAVRINPALFDDRISLGYVLLKQKKFNEAIVCFNEAIKIKPDSAKAHYLLAVTYSLDKKYYDAIRFLTSTLKLDPNYPEARKIMGYMLLATGKLNEAVQFFNEALRTDANQVEIYKSLGLVYSKLGKYEQAIQVWTKARELQPDNIDFLNNLAWVLATSGDVSSQDAAKAIELSKRACELTGYKEPAMLDTLAAAYAAAGRFNDANSTAEQAFNLAKASRQEKLSSEIQMRLKLYKAGQPYHEK